MSLSKDLVPQISTWTSLDGPGISRDTSSWLILPYDTWSPYFTFDWSESLPWKEVQMRSKCVPNIQRTQTNHMPFASVCGESEKWFWFMTSNLQGKCNKIATTYVWHLKTLHGSSFPDWWWREGANGSWIKARERQPEKSWSQINYQPPLTPPPPSFQRKKTWTDRQKLFKTTKMLVLHVRYKTYQDSVLPQI